MKFRCWDKQSKIYRYKKVPLIEEWWDSEVWDDGEQAMEDPFVYFEPTFTHRLVWQMGMEVQDKNGKEIFQGDIVSVYQPENLFEVCYGKVERTVVGHDGVHTFKVEINCFYFRAIDDGKPYFSITENTYGEHDLKGTTIVGNIFENPDLLNYNK